MSDITIHVGDVGTIFRLTIVERDGVTPIDVSAAIVKNILFQKGNGTRVKQNAVNFTDGTDGVIQYASQSGDIDSAGNWQIQGYVELPDGKYYSEVLRFRVLDNIHPTA